MMRPFSLCLTTLLSLSVVACAPDAPSASSAQTAPVSSASTASPTATGEQLSVVATTSVIGEFVRAVGGDRVAVQELVSAGGDAHTFAPSPQSVRTLAGSRALFANGAGLESWLEQATAAAPGVPVFRLADALPLHAAGEEGHQHAEEGHSPDEHGADEHAAEASAASTQVHAEHDHADHDHGPYDPHAWWDADLVAGYLDGVAAALSELDPAGAEAYRQNAQAYLAQVREVDAYGKQQLASIPAEQRRVVTSHGSLNYFAERYGLDTVGAVIPGLSTEREPSAQELAALAQTMREHDVRVILTENVISDRLAQALASESGAVVSPPIYTDALGPAGSPGASYLGALRHNIDTVAAALRGAAK
ncbi:MAG: metal ABC transporter substrate-binding protein [Deinococcus sp.]|nr:metal ABC transporter substrate-binding protein [Deinococcus sp.]